MRGEAEFDEIVMSLVEAAMSLPPEERESYLRSSCTLDPDIHEEVRQRVEWEERMAGFLEEPVLRLRAPVERDFRPGQLIGGRFRILRSLGHGGMGLVYEAEDEKLDRRIALKCAKDGFQNRLSPEARASLEISHPNVCKLHELHTADTPGGPVDFLTMEFIDGVTLAERLKQDGPMPAEEALGIAVQICSGLEQAHQKGVVHGDIKPGNLILSRGQDGTPRAVVTDFGLAKMTRSAPAPHVMSAHGGTLPYMAPELFSGVRASVASDIYALGVLFHMVLTGAVPERSEPSAAPVLKPLPKLWARVVSKCVALDPAARFESVEDIREMLTRRRSVAKWALAAAVVLIAVLAGWLYRVQLAAAGPAIRLAVLPAVLEGADGETARGVMRDVAGRLSGLRRNFSVIQPGDAASNKVDSASKAHDILGATHAVSARIRDTGSRMAAVVTVSDAATGATLKELRAVYDSDDWVTVTKAITATVTGALHLPATVQESMAPAAYAQYVEGLARMDVGNLKPDEAIPFFEKAVELDSRSALPYAGLADAQLVKFERTRSEHWLGLAGANVAKAKGINPDSTRVLMVSGAYQRSHGWYEQAIAEFNRALQIDPSDADVWWELVDTYQAAGRPVEAMETNRKAIEKQPGNFRLYYAFGAFLLSRNDFQQAEAQFRRVIQLAPAFGTGHMNLGQALAEQGRFEEAEREILEAIRLDRDPRKLANLAALYYSQRRFQESAHYLETSIAEGPPTVTRYLNLCRTYRILGRQQDALDACRAGRLLAETEVSRNPRDAFSRVLLGELAAGVGDSRRAESELSQALALDPGDSSILREAFVGFASLGLRDRALEILSRAPAGTVSGLARSPDADPIRGDPRFEQIVQSAAKPHSTQP